MVRVPSCSPADGHFGGFCALASRNILAQAVGDCGRPILAPALEPSILSAVGVTPIIKLHHGDRGGRPGENNLITRFPYEQRVFSAGGEGSQRRALCCFKYRGCISRGTRVACRSTAATSKEAGAWVLKAKAGFGHNLNARGSRLFPEPPGKPGPAGLGWRPCESGATRDFGPTDP